MDLILIPSVFISTMGVASEEITAVDTCGDRIEGGTSAAELLRNEEELLARQAHLHQFHSSPHRCTSDPSASSHLHARVYLCFLATPDLAHIRFERLHGLTLAPASFTPPSRSSQTLVKRYVCITAVLGLYTHCLPRPLALASASLLWLRLHAFRFAVLASGYKLIGPSGPLRVVDSPSLHCTRPAEGLIWTSRSLVQSSGCP